MKLQGGKGYITTHRIPHSEDLNLQVLFTSNLNSILSEWNASSRLSPIYALDNAALPDLSKPKKTWLFFLASANPAEININCDKFVTFGTYNLLIFAKTAGECAAIQKLLDSKLDIKWESWVLKKDEIVEASYSENSLKLFDLPSSLAKKINISGSELSETITEYRALIGAVTGRAQIYLPTLAEELVQFDKIIRILLKDNDAHLVTKHGWLTIANAVLSRLSSQTFTGISPIRETECHFWSHSLLGVGVATQALYKVKRHIEKIVTETFLVARIKALKYCDKNSKSLTELRAVDEFWNRDFIFEDKITEEVEKDSINEIKSPLMVCFSGRDGFRSTQFSLSCPLEIITSCNTVAWTPLTLTHEVSHTIIEGILGAILPRIDDLKSTDEAVGIYNGDLKPENLWDQLREWLYVALVRLEEKNEKIEHSNNISSEDFTRIIIDNWAELNETLTHVFDFLYFYRGTSIHYIRSIWASWGVIPNIRNRIPDYLIRSLCALHAKNLRVENSYEVTVANLLEDLTKVHDEFSSTQYIPEAIEELQNNKEWYVEQLKNRNSFVKFIRFIVYSPKLETQLMAEPGSTGTAKASYPVKFPDIGKTVISNPLRFLDMFSRDKKQNVCKSLWMLMQLAYSETDEFH